MARVRYRLQVLRVLQQRRLTLALLAGPELGLLQGMWGVLEGVLRMHHDFAVVLCCPSSPFCFSKGQHLVPRGCVLAALNPPARQWLQQGDGPWPDFNRQMM
jgi:hypothetical protein